MKEISNPVSYTYISRNRKQTTAILGENTIDIITWTATKGEIRRHYTYPDIRKINLSLPDMGWHSISIRFNDGHSIHLKSLIFWECRDNKLVRAGQDESAKANFRQAQRDYYLWVISLHKRIVDRELQKHIHFKQGDSWRALGLLVAAVATATTFIPMAWFARAYFKLAFFLTATLVFLLFAFRSGFSKTYSPISIPEKYLPGQNAIQ